MTGQNVQYVKDPSKSVHSLSWNIDWWDVWYWDLLPKQTVYPKYELNQNKNRLLEYGVHVNTLITLPEVATGGWNRLRAVVSWQEATLSATVLLCSSFIALSLHLCLSSVTSHSHLQRSPPSAFWELHFQTKNSQTERLIIPIRLLTHQQRHTHKHTAKVNRQSDSQDVHTSNRHTHWITSRQKYTVVADTHYSDINT